MREEGGGRREYAYQYDHNDWCNESPNEVCVISQPAATDGREDSSQILGGIEGERGSRVTAIVGSTLQG